MIPRSANLLDIPEAEGKAGIADGLLNNHG
jgi:hypothetical protein